LGTPARINISHLQLDCFFRTSISFFKRDMNPSMFIPSPLLKTARTTLKTTLPLPTKNIRKKITKVT
jgi:hypothetical protein